MIARAVPENADVECSAFESPWPGSAKKCPKCHGQRVGLMDLPSLSTANYAREVAVCGDCGIAWEPIDESLLWDRADPVCSLSEPCSNCAFRPGSHEQADKVGWKLLLASLRDGASFYCHKGVALDPMGEHGFAYPEKAITAEIDGVKVETTVSDRSQLRLCRGYLNTLGSRNKPRKKRR